MSCARDEGGVNNVHRVWERASGDSLDETTYGKQRPCPPRRRIFPTFGTPYLEVLRNNKVTVMGRLRDGVGTGDWGGQYRGSMIGVLGQVAPRDD